MMHRFFPVGLVGLTAASLAIPRGEARAEVCDASPSGVVSVVRPAKSNGVVEIVNLDGDVKVVGWARSEVSVSGEIDPKCQLDFSPSAERMRVRIVCPHHGQESADLEIHVPSASAVEVKSLSADASVRDVTGALRVESVSGDITIAGAPSEIAVRTTSGNVVINASTAVTRARSVSGEVHVRGVRGKASIESVSGECTLTGGEFSDAEMRTVSGEVIFEGALSGQGSFEFRSHSGDVLLRIPVSTSADFELRTFSGELTTKLAAARASSGALDFRLGNGGARVSVRTFSGDATVEGRK